MENDPRELLTAEDVARLLGLTAATVRLWARAGRFAGAAKVGTGERARWRLPRASVLGVQRLWTPGTPPPAPAEPGPSREELAARYPHLRGMLLG